jgi:hypothetical protein
MFSVILYMLRQTLRRRASPLPFPSLSPLTVTFPKLAVVLLPLYSLVNIREGWCVLRTDHVCKMRRQEIAWLTLAYMEIDILN